MTEQTTGTYVALRVTPASAALIADRLLYAGIDLHKTGAINKLHTTVIYSRVPCPGIQVNPKNVYIAKFAGYDLFSSDNGNDVLVIRLDSKAVVDRHLSLMAEHGATFDYPEFNPHITVSYGFTGNIDVLPPLDFPILLSEEYTEELDLS